MRYRTLPLLVASLFSLTNLTGFAQSSGTEPVAGFPIGVGSSGSANAAAFYLHTDGNFYGTAGGGAFIQTNDPAAAGTLFKLTRSGQFDWVSFTANSGGLPGAIPANSLTPSSDGWLWGMTVQGGVGSSLGTTFRVRPSTFEHQVMGSGSFNGSLAADGMGGLWAAGANVMYRTDEATGTRVTVLTFTGASGTYKGTTPNELYFDGSEFWGTTRTSGDHGGGTAFRFTPQATAPYFTGFATVAHFTSANTQSGQPDGFMPVGRLTPDGLGYLWGTTRQSGNVGTGYGTLFKINKSAGTTETVARFNGGTLKGSYPRGSLAADGNGYLWGVTEQGGNLGAADEGTIFKVNVATNEATTAVNISSLTGADAHVITPANPLTYDGEGYMWGMSVGSSVAAGWTVYKVAVSNSQFTRVVEGPSRGYSPRGTTPVAPLNSTSNSPWLYGSTTGGGAGGYGTLFRHNPTSGEHDVLASFTGNTGSTIGSESNQRLHIHTDGTIWGSSRAALTYGTIFKYIPANRTYTHVFAFTGQAAGNPGQEPAGILATGNDGFIWGTTVREGNLSFNSNGTLFKVNPASGLMTLVKTFLKSNHADGGRPEGGVVADSNGVIWGTTREGGGVGTGSGNGTIFKINPADGVFTSVFKFGGPSTATGSEPDGDLFIDTDGKMWGKAKVSSILTIFKYDPVTNTLTYPTGNGLTNAPVGLNGLYAHSDGKVYGVQDNAGTAPDGKPAGGGMIYRQTPNYPTVITGGVNSGSDDPYPTIVGLLGSVTLNGSSGTYEFEWGTSTALGRTIPASGTPSGGSVSLTATLPELPGLTAFYYRVKMNAAGGPYYGTLRSFKTRQDNGVTDANEIQVESPAGQPLVDNTIGTNLGKVRVGQTVKQAVVIRNIGTSQLGSLAATISGTDSDRFTISTPLSASAISVKYGLAYLFVTYTPDDASTHTAVLTIANNDSNESPFEVLLSGTGVMEPDLRVEQPSGIEVLAGRRGAVDFGSLALGATSSLNFTLRNTGNGPLTGISASIIGDHASEFELTGTIPSNLAVSDSSVFGITFNATLHGSKSAVLKIESDDPDEDPYEVVLVGSGVGSPLIKVVQQIGGTEVLSDTGVPYGNVSLGLSLSKTFLVQNIGTAPLVITGTTFSGGMFTLISSPVGTVQPNESTTIVVAFTPTQALFQQPSYTIASNAANTPSFKLKVTGTGVNDIPDIKIIGPGTAEIADGGSLSFGLAEHPNTQEKSLDITNTGPGTITGISASFAPGSSSAFKITQAPATSVAQGAFTGIFLTYKATANGQQTATLRIASSDPNENPYDINLTGFGMGVPEPEIAIADGATTLFSGTAITLGPVQSGTPLVKTFTISNSGSGPLTGIAATFAAGSSPNFTVSQNPGGTVAATATTTFKVTFTAATNGAQTATLNIASNDADEDPFVISFTATGAGAPEPEIVVEEGNAINVADGGAVSFGSIASHLTVSKVFTIRNTGAAPLTGISVTLTGAGSAAYSVIAPPAATVAKNASTTFSVRFAPTGVAVFNAALAIANSDPDENPFDISLTGTGLISQVPTFPTPPQSRLVQLGTPAPFSAAVTGAATITYQWKKNGANIKDATSTAYTIPATKAGDVGTYTLLAKNGEGENTSPPAYLGLVTKSEGTLTLKQGAILTLNCTATAPKVTGVQLKYLWHDSDGPLSNGGDISGADTKTLKIINLEVADSSTYTCVVTLDTPGADPTCESGDTVVNVVGLPVFSTITLPNYSVSEEVDEVISASGSPKYTASGLPPGVKLDAVTGQLSGKPTAAKTKAPLHYVVKFTATNLAGKDDETVNWTIDGLEPELVGTFHGVVNRHNLTNSDFGGFVQITTAGTGAISGSITLAGIKYSLTGVLVIAEGEDPQATFSVKRTPALGPLNVSLRIPSDNVLSGTISDPQFSAYQSDRALGDGTPGAEDGTSVPARFNAPRGLALTPGGGYVADTGNHTIRTVNGDAGTATVHAGLAGESGITNGERSAARFNAPESLAVDSLGNVYVADTGNHCIRKIAGGPAGQVTTIAGTAGVSGAVNGTGTAAKFSQPCALIIEPVTNNLIVVDRGNHAIRKITPAGVVTTLAGKLENPGFKDGAAATAQFNTPQGITYDAFLKTFFVTDSGNFVIRKVTATGAVTTYAGSPGISGTADGSLANARFRYPTGITSNGLGTLYVTDTLLVQITPGGIVGTITNYTDLDTSMDAPAGIAYEAEGNSLIVADAGLHGLTSHEAHEPSAGAVFTARRAIWNKDNPLPLAYEGKYTASIAVNEPVPTAPEGYGYATLAVTKTTGVAAWAGQLADGSKITFSTGVGPEGQVPLHLMLYKNTGSIQGVTKINSTTGSWITEGGENDLTWRKIPQAQAVKDLLYKAGFDLNLPLNGGKYLPANNIHTFLGLTGSTLNAFVELDEGGVTSFNQGLDITSPNAVKVSTTSNTNALQIKIAPGTGLFTGSFTQGSRKATFAGALVNDVTGSSHAGYGYFLLPTDTAATSPVRSGTVHILAP